MENFKNVAFLHEEFPFGGAETVTLDVASFLKDMGYVVYVFASKIYNSKIPANISNMSTIEMPYEYKDCRNVSFLIEKIKEFNIEILVSPNPNYLNLYFDAVKKENLCKLVFVSHGVPFWEEILRKEFVKRNIRLSLKKAIEWYLFRALKYKLGYGIKKLTKAYTNIYKVVDAFGVLCEDYGKEFAEKIGIDYNNSKFVVLPNSTKEPSCVNLNKSKEVCYIGRLSYADKRVDRLLRVWHMVEAKHKDWILNIVGEGPEIDNLKKLSSELHLENVYFRGFASNPKDYYDTASIVCLTSTTESWGLVLTEAQSNGCVAMAFDCSAGVRTILSPSWNNGVLIEPFNMENYAEAISKLMSDIELRREMAMNGIETVKRFYPNNILKKWNIMFSRLR